MLYNIYKTFNFTSIWLEYIMKSWIFSNQFVCNCYDWVKTVTTWEIEKWFFQNVFQLNCQTSKIEFNRISILPFLSKKRNKKKNSNSKSKKNSFFLLENILIVWYNQAMPFVKTKIRKLQRINTTNTLSFCIIVFFHKKPRLKKAKK